MVDTVGIFTGLTDSNGTPIKSGDRIRYEYKIGFNLSSTGEEIDSFPFSETKSAFHETTIKYEVKKNGAGYFLDIPESKSFVAALFVSLNYYVVESIVVESIVGEPYVVESIMGAPTAPPARLLKKAKAAVIIFHKNIQNYPEKWVNDCICSIKNQTYKDFDVFEVDYGDTWTQVYKGSHFESTKFDNHADAHNFLLDKVFSLDYDCAFNVNIDDVYAVNRFERQIACIEEGYDVVSSNYYNMDENGDTIKAMLMSDKNIENEMMYNHNIIAHPSVCYSRKFWTTCTKLKGDEIPLDDFKLWKRSIDSREYKFLILPDYLLYYRVHENKVSKSK